MENLERLSISVVTCNPASRSVTRARRVISKGPACALRSLLREKLRPLCPAPFRAFEGILLFCKKCRAAPEAARTSEIRQRIGCGPAYAIPSVCFQRQVESRIGVEDGSEVVNFKYDRIGRRSLAFGKRRQTSKRSYRGGTSKKTFG